MFGWDFLSRVERLEPVEVWHGDVGDDHIGPQPFCGLNHCAPILDNPDELKLVGEKRFEAFGHHAVVVSQQHPRTNSWRASSLQSAPERQSSSHRPAHCR